jgi:hypothetical protein
MAKKNIVTFTTSDMPKPKKLASGLIGLRSPIDFTVGPGKTELVDLDTKTSTLLITADGVFEPGKNIVITVKNELDVPVNYAAGDVIARAYPLFGEDYEIA